MVKRVCILRSNGINPDSRVEKEAATLAKLGYDVSIVCWDRGSDHALQECSEEYYSQKVRVFRFGYKSTFGDGIKNIIPYLKFQLSLQKWLTKNREQYDIIHACDFDTAWASSLANYRVKAKYVFDIFDFLYGEPKTIFQQIVKKAQIRIINNSDATIICTEERKKQIKEANPKNLTIIHNTPIKTANIENIKKVENKKIRIVYVGILQDHRFLIEMSQYFKENPDVELHIGGFGKYEKYFRDLSNAFKNVFYYGKLPYKDTIELEINSDIMLAIYDPTIENHRFAAPNKFYESLMLGKPVVMVKGTGMSDYVEEYNIGKTINYNYESFKKGVNELINKKKDWESMSTKMQNLYAEQFSWAVMEDRLSILYEKLMEG